ncbi:MAG TPA: valine--tRNA ligase, partial [Jatrophihabitantaceae bacterium]
SAGEAEIRSLVRLEVAGSDFVPTASLTTAGGVTVELDLSAAIDVAAERARLAKELAAARKERDVNAAKLGNEAFTGKAPDAVVAKVRGRLVAADADIARIDAALAALPGA